MNIVRLRTQALIGPKRRVANPREMGRGDTSTYTLLGYMPGPFLTEASEPSNEEKELTSPKL